MFLVKLIDTPYQSPSGEWIWFKSYGEGRDLSAITGNKTSDNDYAFLKLSSPLYYPISFFYNYRDEKVYNTIIPKLIKEIFMDTIMMDDQREKEIMLERSNTIELTEIIVNYLKGLNYDSILFSSELTPVTFPLILYMGNKRNIKWVKTYIVFSEI